MKTPYLEIKYDEEKVKTQSEYQLSSLIGVIKEYAEKRDMLFEIDEDNTMRVSIKRDEDYGYIFNLSIDLLVCDPVVKCLSVLFYCDGDPREDEEILSNFKAGKYDKYMETIKKAYKSKK